MPQGKGKYDALCIEVLEKSNADCAMVIVINGNSGSGFSVNSVNPDIVFKIPDLLEYTASMLRDDIEKMKTN